MAEQPEPVRDSTEPRGSGAEPAAVELGPAPQAPSAATAVPGPVTGLARVAAVILLLFGIWFAILGWLTILAALDPSGFMGRQIGAGFGAVARGTVAFIGVGVLVVALIEIGAAIGVWRGKTWGRALGVIYAIVFGLGSIGALATSHGPSTLSIALAAGIVIAYGFVALVLAAAWRHRTPPADPAGRGH